MALSAEVQQLVNQEKWTEAYAKASGERGPQDADSFLVQVQNNTSKKEGYVKGDATNYTLTLDASEASAWSKKDALSVARDIKKKDRTQKISTMLVKSSEVLEPIGSQGTEKGEVIDLFLDKRFKNYDVSPIKDTFVKLIEELGFSYNTNPFLQFADLYFQKNGTMTKEAFNLANDFYAENVIDTKDLQGKSFEMTNNIMFNRNLAKFKKEDAEFIVRAFDWLAKPDNLKNHMNNPDALAKYKITDKSQIDDKKAKEIRNAVLFTNPADFGNSDIIPVADIQTETRFFEQGGVEKQDRQTVFVNDVVGDENRWKQLTQANNMTPDKMTTKEARDLITHLAKEFGLI